MTPSRALPGAALLIAAGAAVVKSGSAITAGHWSYFAWLVVVVLLGLLLVVWAFTGDSPKPGAVRGVLHWLAAALGVGLAAATFWLAPYPADPVAGAHPAVSVSTSGGGILMLPVQARSTAVAFIPGALVDPRAYESIFAPIVQAGYPVYIAKPPMGIAFTVPDVVGDAQAADPVVEQWVVAGHSLGGAVASGQSEGAAGLILLGAYPIDDMSAVKIPVLSVSGSHDGLTTPEDVDASKAKLPPDAEFVVIDGGIHAYFGDYGTQRGDGQPGISREDAQAQTRQAMIDFLDRIASQAPLPQ